MHALQNIGLKIYFLTNPLHKNVQFTKFVTNRSCFLNKNFVAADL